MKKSYLFFVLIMFFHLASAQEIKSYDLTVKINVESENIQVKGLIDIDFENNDSISLVLWKNSAIRSITSNQFQVRFYFDSVSPSPIIYVPDGRNLVIYKSEISAEKQLFLFDYECDMHELNGWARSFSEEWIEINYYGSWFPLNENSIHFTSKIIITIDDKYSVTGSGIVTREDGIWKMLQPWASFDNVIIASKNLKSKVLIKNNSHIEIDYCVFPESAADSLISECNWVSDFYQRLFGKTDSTYLKFVATPFDGGGGYSRKNFVSMRTKKFNFNTRGGIGHEMAHFWWSNANTSTWEDWLNEAFAEYSMLIYFRERLGSDVFYEQIEEYRKRTMNTPPVWGIGRDTREAYSVLYEKGALILYDMEQKVGKDLFFGFLKTVSDNKVKTTNELLDLVK